MLGRHVYRVYPVETGWAVVKEGEDHPRGEYSERQQAISDAVRFAESNEPARVTIESGEGTIVNEWLFGDDPIEELEP